MANIIELSMDRIHYLGFLLLPVIVFQSIQNSRFYEQTLNESVERQERIRDYLWLDLLTQRAMVLALQSHIENKSELREKSLNVIEAIPALMLTQEAVNSLDTGGDGVILKDITSTLKSFDHASDNSQLLELSKLTKRVESAGSDLTAREFAQWGILREKNGRLLKQNSSQQFSTMVIYGIFGLFLVLFRLTANRKRRAEIREKKIELESQNLRLETEVATQANISKSMFLANMSHELRTPMHGVLSFARFGIRDINDPKKSQSMKMYFEEILESGERLMNLLNDLLDLSKLESGKMQYTPASTDLKPLIEKLVASLSAYAIEGNHAIRVNMGNTPPVLEIVIDADRIYQVIQNLISNAIKFSDPKSEIVIELDLSDGRVSCSVANHGKPIPQNELETIFDKFVQSSKTRSAAGGTGLGLSICREIVQHHKGKIWAESSADGMTRFTFSIPTNFLQQVSDKKRIEVA
jgi:signal transduction histidine kinase